MSWRDVCYAMAVKPVVIAGAGLLLVFGNLICHQCRTIKLSSEIQTSSFWHNAPAYFETERERRSRGVGYLSKRRVVFLFPRSALIPSRLPDVNTPYSYQSYSHYSIPIPPHTPESSETRTPVCLRPQSQNNAPYIRDKSNE